MNVAVLLTALSPLLPTLVKSVDKLFGSKTGQAKKDVVVTAVNKVVETMAAAGRLPGLPDASMITDAVETVVANLNATGQLQGEYTQVLPSVDRRAVQEGVKQMLGGALQLMQSVRD